MKIIELTESEPKDRDEILKLIKKDCKPFLQRIGNKIGTYKLYRGLGFDSDNNNILRKKVRLHDRRPMSTAQIKHERYNEFFEVMFGEPFRNSLFVSGNEDMAKFYGEPYVIFPIGDFDWVWSTAIEDIAMDITWANVGAWVNIPPGQKEVDEKLGSLNYTINSNFLGAIESGNEIMIRCKEYYATKIHVFKDM